MCVRAAARNRLIIGNATGDSRFFLTSVLVPSLLSLSLAFSFGLVARCCGSSLGFGGRGRERKYKLKERAGLFERERERDKADQEKERRRKKARVFLRERERERERECVCVCKLVKKKKERVLSELFRSLLLWRSVFVVQLLFQVGGRVRARADGRAWLLALMHS